MRSPFRVHREAGTSVRIDDFANAIDVVDLSREKYVEIVRE